MEYELNIEHSFTDKVTDEFHKVGDVITVNEARAKELLADSRNLVTLKEKIPSKKPTKKDTTKRK